MQTLHTPIAQLMGTKLIFLATHIVKAQKTQLLVAPINTIINETYYNNYSGHYISPLSLS